MKYQFLIFILFAMAVYSCKKLDLSPLQNLTVDTYFKNADDAKAAVGACYAQVANTYRDGGLVSIDITTTDDAIPFLTGGADRPLLWRYNLTPSNSLIDYWSGPYNSINRANVVLDRIPGIQMDDNLKKQYIGEARFIRALNYFNLVRLYGGVPIVTSETESLDNLTVERSSVAEVYTLIEADLKEAETILPVKYSQASDRGRATKGAAKALLAKVYLTQAGNTPASSFWTVAATKAKEVIDLEATASYGLWANYGEAFSMANRGGKEVVFDVQFLTDVFGHNLGRGYGVRSAPIYPAGGAGIARVTASIFNSFSGTDTRKPITFITSYTFNGVTTQLSLTDPDPTKGIYFQKLWDPSAKTNGGEGTSIPIIRYSDVLLMYAEALSEAGGGPTAQAYTAINRVRIRAGITPLSGLSAQQFKDSVLVERRRELSFENSRRFDLVRTGRLIQAVQAENSFNRNAAIQSFHYLLPIPQREIDANPTLVQNPGY